jgi:hypothetical protein
LTEAQILAWADGFFARTGRWPPRTCGHITGSVGENWAAWAEIHFRHSGTWPNTRSGPVTGVPNENWLAIDAALRVGVRALPGGSSLFQLLRDYRNRRR